MFWRMWQHVVSENTYRVVHETNLTHSAEIGRYDDVYQTVLTAPPPQTFSLPEYKFLDHLERVLPLATGVFSWCLYIPLKFVTKSCHRLFGCIPTFQNGVTVAGMRLWSAIVGHANDSWWTKHHEHTIISLTWRLSHWTDWSREQTCVLLLLGKKRWFASEILVVHWT